MTEVRRTTYRNEEEYPFCKGCGHGNILDSLDAALVKLQLDPREVVIVTDIGCVGLSDRFFVTNAFHGPHGRSVTYATGIKLADPNLRIIVLIGDGGCGIGGHHLINAARRNIGVTVLVFNNLNFGMTGGQHSVTTPPDVTLKTTWYGHLERPLDICKTVAINGASFVARTFSNDKALSDLMVQAIENEGFSLIDIWELCTGRYVKSIKVDGRVNKEFLPKSVLARLGFATGIVHRETRTEYTQAYRDATAALVSEERPMDPEKLEPVYSNRVESKTHCIIAGAAGGGIRFASTAFSRGAVLSGLWVTQRNDYPVTVESGYSVSEVILSPEEIFYTGIPKPDLMVVLFPEGLAKVESYIEKLTEDSTLYINAKLLPVETRAKKVAIDFEKAGNWARKEKYWALMALAEVLRDSQFYPLEAFKEALSKRKEFAEQNLAAVEASEGLIG